jgi:hypothetical protein
MFEKMDKKKKPETDMQKEAKLTALKDLRSLASSMMGEGLKSKMEAPKKAVTVAADDEKSLMEGLDKAKEMVPEMEDMMPEAEEEETEESSEKDSEIADLKKQIEELKAMMLNK